MSGLWLRLYTEVRRDRKLRRLPPEQRWLWVVILTIAKESPRPGWLLLAEGVPVTIDDLADEAAIPVDQVKAGLNSFAEQMMIDKVNGVWHCLNWDKRNFVSDNSTERSRKHRSNTNATLQNRCNGVAETPPETDKQTNRDQRSETETDIKTSAHGAAADGNEKPTNKDLIDELTQSYRAVEVIKPAKGDHSFIGALYNKHGYEQVLDAINKLQMAAATQDLKKPLLYLKGILEPKDEGGNGSGGKPREPTADRKGVGAGDGNSWDNFYAPGAAPPKV